MCKGRGSDRGSKEVIEGLIELVCEGTSEELKEWERPHLE